MRQVEGTTLRGEEATLPGPAGPKSSVIYLAFPAISKSPPVFDFTGKRRSRSRQLLSVTQRYIRGTAGHRVWQRRDRKSALFMVVPRDRKRGSLGLSWPPGP